MSVAVLQPGLTGSEPVFDPGPVAELRSMLDDETVRDIGNEFRQTAPELLERIRVALPAADLATCQIESHGLKSAAASLGLMRLAAACQGMEMACKEGRSPAEVQLFMPDIEQNLQPSLDALEQAGV